MTAHKTDLSQSARSRLALCNNRCGKPPALRRMPGKDGRGCNVLYHSRAVAPRWCGTPKTNKHQPPAIWYSIQGLQFDIGWVAFSGNRLCLGNEWSCGYALSGFDSPSETGKALCVAARPVQYCTVRGIFTLPRSGLPSRVILEAHRCHGTLRFSSKGPCAAPTLPGIARCKQLTTQNGAANFRQVRCSRHHSSINQLAATCAKYSPQSQPYPSPPSDHARQSVRCQSTNQPTNQPSSQPPQSHASPPRVIDMVRPTSSREKRWRMGSAA